MFPAILGESKPHIPGDKLKDNYPLPFCSHIAGMLFCSPSSENGILQSGIGMEPFFSITILDLPKVIFAHAPAGGIVSGLGNFVPGLGIIGGALSMGSKGCPSLPILILQEPSPSPKSVYF